MSKIGKKTIAIPKESKVTVNQDKLVISGPKGSHEIPINAKIFSAEVKENLLTIKPIKLSDEIKKPWGTLRSLVNNAVQGTSVGYKKTLELSGVGYRAVLKGNDLNLSLGFSHNVVYKIPKEVKVLVEKQTIIKLDSNDKQLIGKVASEITSLKPVEPYKGKGIKEFGQYVLRKEGKKK